LSSKGQHPVPWVQAMYDILPLKCRKCECVQIDYNPDLMEVMWVCELEQQGEKCYLEEDSNTCA